MGDVLEILMDVQFRFRDAKVARLISLATVEIFSNFDFGTLDLTKLLTSIAQQ
jgi:hypothetical protein